MEFRGLLGRAALMIVNDALMMDWQVFEMVVVFPEDL